ncbi:tetratricopeptide repeat protein [Pontimicrobium aquaticum]|uniref:Tetratricopeptide repeat protein n=1 Tax=Pontimicrobium aquaticum TaxID=2565367 RepID=A0A4U0EYF7_9FLAO|nr:tetratricopeptide repeat protein [Pontimicrobium aquaticum]TJY37057.1 tetratricopeptide repeat protein [Pontimicrobium aquaticum]
MNTKKKKSSLLFTITMLFFSTTMVIAQQAMVIQESATLKEEPVTKDYKPLVPQDALQAVVKAFDSTSIVAMGERHNVEEVQDFYLDLLSYKPFIDKVNDIVIELGNPLHQDLLDEYIYGGDVSMEELKKVWRDGTHSIVHAYQNSSIQKFLKKVRDVNKALPKEKKIRVLGGDSPIDWSKIKNSKDWRIMMSRRDRYYGTLVWDEVIDRGRSALLIMGADHFKRDNPRPMYLNIVSFLETRMMDEGKKVSIINYYDKPLEGIDFKKPFVTKIKGTKIGDERNQPRYGGLKYERQVDAIIYFGANTELHEIFDEPNEPEWTKVLDKRSMIVNGHKFKTFITNAIHYNLNTKGRKATKKWWNEVVIDLKPDTYDYNEMFFIMQGYDYIAQNKTENAVFIFELGASLYPDSWNMHDSLGEAYYKNNQKEKAIEHYNKSLELNPQNDNATKMINEIKS